VFTDADRMWSKISQTETRLSSWKIVLSERLHRPGTCFMAFSTAMVKASSQTDRQ
jgi:hypothetical protein